MNLIEILQYISATIVGILLSYQMLLSLLALKAKKVHNFEASRNRKFAIVIPAYNDDKVISRSLYSLSGLVYPKNMYDLFVITENRTDSSAMIAYKLGAAVLEQPDAESQSKGVILRWAFNHILKGDEQYDAIVVFDSDGLVSGNYLEVMNYYLDQGSKVVQGSDLILPQPRSWSVETTRIGYVLYNFVKPLGRKVLGFGTKLCGNGMCFSTNVLREVPWQSWILTEDIEYGLMLQLNGIPIDFAPEANVWSEFPASVPKVKSKHQQKKMSRYQIIKKYAPGFLKAVVKQRSLNHFDSLVDLVTPPLVNVLFFTLLMSIVNLGFWIFASGSLLFFWMWMIITGLGITHLFIGLMAAGADRQLLKSVGYIPLYAFWKIKRDVTWFFSNGNDKDKEWAPKKENSDVI